MTSWLQPVRLADAILPRYVNIERHHIQAMQRCKIIARSGIGVDIVDVSGSNRARHLGDQRPELL
jgi:lactate dehydrogenase-like 2-hydroxyacid dehydrogenase